MISCKAQFVSMVSCDMRSRQHQINCNQCLATFHGGMDRFKSYLLKEGASFSGAELVAIMDSFKDPLHSHLKSEPPAIVALAEYNTPDTPIDILGIADAAGKSTQPPFWVSNLKVELISYFRKEASHIRLLVQHSARVLFEYGDRQLRRRHVA